MTEWIQWALLLLICLTSALSVFYSFRSRRQTEPVLRGLYAARMNVCMGIMLIFIASIQMLLYTGSTVRVIVCAVLLVIGLFNLFAGLRNHGHFQRLMSPQK